MEQSKSIVISFTSSVGTIGPFPNLTAVMNHKAAIPHADRLIQGSRKGEKRSAIASRIPCTHMPHVPDLASCTIADEVSNEGPIAVALGIFY